MKPIEDFHQLILDNTCTDGTKHWRDAKLYTTMRIPVRRELDNIIFIFYLITPLNSITTLNRPHL